MQPPIKQKALSKILRANIRFGFSIDTHEKPSWNNHESFFSHPDYTVGFGISPNQRICARGLYRRWGITPRPEEFSFICFYYMPQREFFQEISYNLLKSLNITNTISIINTRK